MMVKNQFQVDAYKDPTRFKYLLAGRRGGKTFLITNDICKTIRHSKRGSKIFYIGPTNAQTKALMWEPLQDAFYRCGWKFEPKVSDQCFILKGNRKIFLIGAEKISRIRGHACIKVYLDELAFFSKDLNEVWRAVRPTLSDFGGHAILATTPNGEGTQAYDLYMEAMDKHNWATHSWKTIDNPYIPKEEIEEAKRELDKQSYLQEYEAQWQSFVGLAYYSFLEASHIKKQPQVTADMPLHLCFDFNVNPTTLLLSQYDGQMFRYKKEYSFKNSSTEATIKAFCDDFDHMKDQITLKIRGDAAGSSRSANTGKSDYYYIEEQLKFRGFKFEKQVPRANPPIVDRVKFVNSWLQPMVGRHRIEIDPSCKDLIRDLAAQELKGRHPSEANNLGHKADALGYDIFWQQRSEKKKPPRMEQL